jgi:transcriptional regulator with XRE-family HTH domain
MLVKHQATPVDKFATRLRELRERENWTQDDLAGELECDRAYISQLERGIQNPSLLTMVKLAKIFAVEITFAGTSSMA